MVEVLIVVAIVTMLIVIAAPEMGRLQTRSQSVACANNLRQIGVAVQLYVNDNDGRFPRIESNPANPVYQPEDEAKPMLETLQPYGVNELVLRCPADARGKKYHLSHGSSYEWRPFADDELEVNPVIYGRRGARQIKPSRLRIVMDYEGVHNGRQNWLFADGRVTGFYVR